MFQYPEGGAWINIFNCSFCVSQRWDSQYEKGLECLIRLQSFAPIYFYNTIPEGTLPFPRWRQTIHTFSQYSKAPYKVFTGGYWAYYLMPAKHQTLFSYDIAWLSNILFVCFKRPLGKCLSFSYRSTSCFHVQLSFSIACFPQKFFIVWWADSDLQTGIFFYYALSVYLCVKLISCFHILHLVERTTPFKTDT